MRVVISESNRIEWTADFEKTGEAEVRASLAFNTLSYSTEKLMLAREWVELVALARIERNDELATDRHRQLLEEIKRPHWSVTPGFIFGVMAAVAGLVAAVYAYLSYAQQLQSAAKGPPSAQTVASGPQRQASSSLPPPSSPAAQSSRPQK